MELVKYNNNSISSVTALGSLPAGGLNLLATNNITSGVSSSSFTSNIDSTYDTYLFKYISVHPSGDNVNFTVNFRDGSSAFDAVKQTSVFFANGTESGSGTQLASSAGSDLAQSTGYQNITDTLGYDDDSCCCGELFLFSPSSTTHITHFLSRGQTMWANIGSIDWFVQGYCDTTSAIDGVDFKFESGNIDSGIFKMYGLSKS